MPSSTKKYMTGSEVKRLSELRIHNRNSIPKKSVIKTFFMKLVDFIFEGD